ncbi:MAG: hypothetical protein V4660_09400 [Pseudomonadota bacterium]
MLLFMLHVDSQNALQYSAGSAAKSAVGILTPVRSQTGTKRLRFASSYSVAFLLWRLDGATFGWAGLVWAGGQNPVQSASINSELMEVGLTNPKH